MVMERNVWSSRLGLPASTARIVTHITDLEEVGDEILKDRQTIIDYDRKRNANRESLRHLRNQTGAKTWIAMGNTFFKLETTAVSEIIRKDQIKLDEAINTLRDDLKKKVDKVRDLDAKPSLKGFQLNPLSPEDLHVTSGPY